MRGVFSNANDINLILVMFQRTSLSCKLVPVQYREYEYLLLCFSIACQWDLLVYVFVLIYLKMVSITFATLLYGNFLLGFFFKNYFLCSPMHKGETEFIYLLWFILLSLYKYNFLFGLFNLRYLVRVEEMRQSLRIIHQVCFNIRFHF